MWKIDFCVQFHSDSESKCVRSLEGFMKVAINTYSLVMWLSDTWLRTRMCKAMDWEGGRSCDIWRQKILSYANHNCQRVRDKLTGLRFTDAAFHVMNVNWNDNDNGQIGQWIYVKGDHNKSPFFSPLTIPTSAYCHAPIKPQKASEFAFPDSIRWIRHCLNTHRMLFT